MSEEGGGGGRREVLCVTHFPSGRLAGLQRGSLGKERTNSTELLGLADILLRFLARNSNNNGGQNI